MKKTLKKLEHFPNYLGKRIIGQDHIFEAFTEKIRYGERQITNPSRPRGCFLFLGPTGVGKTELVNETINYFFGDINKYMLRLDMSEFGETAGEDVGTKLIGKNENNPGRLYHFLNNSSEGVILYDEFEKAHKDLAKYMLQQLDAARVTLWDNKTYDLSKYYLFFTSNIAANIFQGNNHLSMERKVNAALNSLRQRFSPEFVARFGAYGYGIYAFKALEADSLRKIAVKFINDNAKRFMNIKETNPKCDNLFIKGISHSIIEHVIRQINSNKNGAREIRDVTERMMSYIYDHAFMNEELGQDRDGYIDIVDNRPCFTIQAPEKIYSMDKNYNLLQKG